VPGIWTLLPSHPSISWPVDWMFRRGFVLSWRPDITACLTAFPRATMLILIVGVAQTKAFVLDLATPAASQ
jgi:predicted membrane-bound dolichyl-phosphate-mannose-protein mannosyltransferase